MYGEIVLQDALVPKMTVCVTFGASRIGANFRNVCALSEYVTFSTISATAVREMTVCVTFGAPHFGFPVAMWRRPAVDHIGGVSHGSGFPQLRSEFVLGRHRVACFFCRAQLFMRVDDHCFRGLRGAQSLRWRNAMPMLQWVTPGGDCCFTFFSFALRVS